MLCVAILQIVAKYISVWTKFSSLSKISNAFCLIIEFKFAKKWQNYNSRRLTKLPGVQIVLFQTGEENGRSFNVCTSRKFTASGLRKGKFGLIFYEKVWILKNLTFILAKKTLFEPSSVLRDENNKTTINNSIIFQQNWRKLGQKYRKCEEKQLNHV